jgi:hypothetical protein
VTRTLPTFVVHIPVSASWRLRRYFAIGTFRPASPSRASNRCVCDGGLIGVWVCTWPWIRPTTAMFVYFTAYWVHTGWRARQSRSRDQVVDDQAGIADRHGYIAFAAIGALAVIGVIVGVVLSSGWAMRCMVGSVRRQAPIPGRVTRASRGARLARHRADTRPGAGTPRKSLGEMT